MSESQSINNTDEKAISALNNVYTSLQKALHDSARVLKLVDLYGSWGLTYSFQVGFPLYILPFIATILMFVIFKRRKLLGVTQKFILSIMVMDLCYTSTSSIRDTLLRLFQMHYGFMEYRVCAEIIVSFRVQMLFHATSVWLKTMMSLHQVLIVGFPLRVKQHNLSAYFYSFILVHIALCLAYLVFLATPVFEPVPLIQEFRSGYPLHKIIGCQFSHSRFFPDINDSLIGTAITLIIFLYNQIIPFIFHFITIMMLVFLLTKHIRTLSLLTNNIAVERVKYVVLMKVNIAMGVSFVLQELPVILFFAYQIVYSGKNVDNLAIYEQYQGFATSVMSISFCIGKPIDLLIYCSLSRSFKEELKYIISLCCRPGRRKVNSEKGNGALN